jgi:hypothetical protein
LPKPTGRRSRPEVGDARASPARREAPGGKRGKPPEDDTGFTAADRDSAGPSKNRTIREAVKALFKDAAKAVARGGEDEEPEPRRKSGETEGEFRRLARSLWRRSDLRQGFRLWSAITSRYAPIDPAAHAVATEYLANTLDTLNQLDDSAGADYSDSFNAIPNPHSLNL